MALEAALADLCSQLKRLSAQVDIAEKRALDMPEGQDHYLAGEIGDAARDATGWLRKVRRKAQRARRSLAQGTELPRVRNALTNCQRILRSVRRGPARVLMSTRKREDLKDLAHRRPRIWSDWVADVSTALRDLVKPWRAIEKAMSRCWQELAEYGTASQVTIQNIAVGQQLTGKRRK